MTLLQYVYFDYICKKDKERIDNLAIINTMHGGSSENAKIFLSQDNRDGKFWTGLFSSGTLHRELIY